MRHMDMMEKRTLRAVRRIYHDAEIPGISDKEIKT
jgi:hypothetical protein